LLHLKPEIEAKNKGMMEMHFVNDAKYKTMKINLKLLVFKYLKI